MSSGIDVSVIIPTFRRERQVVESVCSVLAQPGLEFEVIVVDDSPEASARDAVQAIGDGRVRYVSCAQPSGGRPALVRNEGARLASGRYLYFLDDDDLLEPGVLPVMVNALDSDPRAGMVFGVITPFGDDAQRLSEHAAYFREAREVALRLRTGIQLQACITYSPTVLVCSACLGRRSAFEAVGGFDASIPVCEDSELWARVAGASGFEFIDRSVVRYRTGAASMMQSLKPDDGRLAESYRIIQDKFRDRHGRLGALAWKAWVRLFLR